MRCLAEPVTRIVRSTGRTLTRSHDRLAMYVDSGGAVDSATRPSAMSALPPNHFDFGITVMDGPPRRATRHRRRLFHAGHV